MPESRVNASGVAAEASQTATATALARQHRGHCGWKVLPLGAHGDGNEHQKAIARLSLTPARGKAEAKSRAVTGCCNSGCVTLSEVFWKIAMGRALRTSTWCVSHQLPINKRCVLVYADVAIVVRRC
jgi:hypothetical protein